MTEAGLDTLRNGEEAQARALDWQVRTAFAAGCAGHVRVLLDGRVVPRRLRRSTTGPSASSTATAPRSRRWRPSARRSPQVPFSPDPDWPRVSVVVCAYNSESTLRSCLDGLRDLDYPDYEVIVVNDGSTDATDEIARRVRLPADQHREPRPRRARATPACEAATGEIVAYIDADARPDPHWLCHLATAFMKSSHAGIGGPNIPPLGRRRDRRMRRQRARRADPRAALRRDRRAHPGLQHGLLEDEPRGDRRLRPAVPHRGRRRRHLLAAPGPGLDGRLQPRRGRLAPPPRLACAAT